MTLDLEMWKTILNVTGNIDVLEQIKAELKKQDENIYQEWEKIDFDLNHLFSVLIDGQIEKLTLLHIAASNGNLEIVQYLKEQGADVNQASNNGSTALHFAAYNGYLDVVQYFKEQGADVNL